MSELCSRPKEEVPVDDGSIYTCERCGGPWEVEVYVWLCKGCRTELEAFIANEKKLVPKRESTTE